MPDIGSREIGLFTCPPTLETVEKLAESGDAKAVLVGNCTIQMLAPTAEIDNITITAEMQRATTLRSIVRQSATMPASACNAAWRQRWARRSPEKRSAAEQQFCLLVSRGVEPPVAADGVGAVNPKPLAAKISALDSTKVSTKFSQFFASLARMETRFGATR